MELLEYSFLKTRKLKFLELAVPQNGKNVRRKYSRTRIHHLLPPLNTVFVCGKGYSYIKMVNRLNRLYYTIRSQNRTLTPTDNDEYHAILDTLNVLNIGHVEFLSIKDCNVNQRSTACQFYVFCRLKDKYFNRKEKYRIINNVY